MLMDFLEPGRDLKLALTASYDPVLVGCSISAAALAAYAAIGIAEQIRVARGLVTTLMWLTTGAVAMGLGIWTMHFTAMLAYRLPVAVRYDTLLTVLSVLPAIGAAAVMLHVITRPRIRSGSIAFGGLLIGGGIGAMHFTGMAAMRVDADMLYSLSRVALAVLIAVCLGALALYTHNILAKASGANRLLHWSRSISALIMGVAVSGMHYSAMAAVYFFPARQWEILPTGGTFDGNGIAISLLLSCAILSLLFIVLTHEAELRAHSRAEQAALLQNSLLEEKVRERTRELEQANVMASEILKRKIAERTEELAMALEAATTADRAKSEFMANVTHELRTPLNSVIGFSELLKDEVAGPLNPKQAAFAADIHASGARLLTLVEGILKMSRLNAGNAVLKHAPVRIAETLEERVAAHRGAAAARGLTLRLEVAEDVDGAALDPGLLARILDALVDNAIKFNREGSEVAVSARRADGALEVAVADTGIGIAREDFPKLFKPLVQLDAGLARRHGGVGLGLALARRLAELLGGTLNVQSEPDKGSTFTLRLPIREQS